MVDRKTDFARLESSALSLASLSSTRCFTLGDDLTQLHKLRVHLTAKCRFTRDLSVQVEAHPSARRINTALKIAVAINTSR
jgi:hypothetical protein